MLSRTVITRSGKGFRVLFPSSKMKCQVACESILERDVALYLEFSTGVISYREQPTVIHYHDGQKLRMYFPDFEVVLQDGALVHIEVKSASKLAAPETQTKYEAIATHYRTRPEKFQIITEFEIRKEPLLSNLRMLAYLSSKRPNKSLPSVETLLNTLGMASLPFHIAAEKLGQEATLHLIAQGVLHCDLAQALSGNTPVAIRQGECDATYLL